MDCFQNIIRTDVLYSGQIGERASDLQNPVVGAGGEVHLLHGVFEVAIRLGIELAVLPHLAGTHGGIRGVRKFSEPFQLDLPRRYDTLADGLGFLTQIRVG